MRKNVRWSDIFGLMLAGLGFLGCRPGATATGPMAADGSPIYGNLDQVSSGRAASDTFVALIIDPANCLSCDGRIVFMFAAKRQYPHLVSVILSRRPSEAERRQLVLNRLTIDAQMDPSGRWDRSAPPLPFGLAHVPPAPVRPVPLDSLQSLVRSLLH